MRIWHMRIWHMRIWHMKTIVIPVVVAALGTVKKGMVENIKKVSERATVTENQNICMLGSAQILRKVPNIIEIIIVIIIIKISHL